jgi:hypothetical protein
MLVGAMIFCAGGMFFYRPATSRSLDGLLPVAFRSDATSMGKSFSIATGIVDDSTEGVFILDHLTGNLQCWIMNARSGEIGGIFRGNITAALGLQGKADPDFVLATGRFDFTNFRKGSLRYANCICYVGESSTGKILGYSFAYDATVGARGQPQTGDLELITTIAFRDETLIRD